MYIFCDFIDYIFVLMGRWDRFQNFLSSTSWLCLLICLFLFLLITTSITYFGLLSSLLILLNKLKMLLFFLKSVFISSGFHANNFCLEDFPWFFSLLLRLPFVLLAGVLIGLLTIFVFTALRSFHDSLIPTLSLKMQFVVGSSLRENSLISIPSICIRGSIAPRKFLLGKFHLFIIYVIVWLH